MRTLYNRSVYEVISDAKKIPGREKILRLENEIRNLAPVELPIKHHFSNGIYAREMFIPKGTVLTGKIHKTENMNILALGEISVLTEEGVQRLKAYQTIISKPGTKRVGYAHEDTIWITLHATEEKDVGKIEEIFIAKDYEDFDRFILNMMPALSDKREAG